MIDYPAHLESMWQKAIAPREANAPTVVSPFAGGGGSLTGYLMAGYRDLLAVEWDGNAVATLRANYPDLDIYHGDIAKLTVDEVLERTGLKPGDLDILDGSPPCQGFSTAGKRVMDDPRNQLFREYVRLLRGLRPKVLVMENVSGMVKGKMRLVFVDILKELKASGYRVSAKLLNAMYFHVPQSRQRMIFIGVREDLGIEPSHPKAESKPFTVRDATGGLVFDTTEATAKVPKYLAEILPKMRDGEPASHYSDGVKYFSHKRNWANKPSRTILKQPDTYHHIENRLLTREELKLLTSFPVGFEFHGNLIDHYNRIGNSVPPLFMEAIARHIRAEILARVAA